MRAARFVPPPPGLNMRARLQDLLDWIRNSAALEIDPVVAAGLAHYQFETLHPSVDGNGRIGRLLIVMHLLLEGVLLEPTLTVSPWFEARRTEYYDRLLAVSREGDWDGFTAFFARGLEASARSTHERVLALVAVQEELKARVRRSPLRAETARLSYGRANKLVDQLVELGILSPLPSHDVYRRRFYAPAVIRVLTEDKLSNQ